MKKRYIYSILYGVPGLVIALVFALFVFGAGAGFLWLFVSGDNPWPESATRILPMLSVLVFISTWLTAIVVGFTVGKRLEDKPGLNRSHVLVSVAATAAPLALIVLHQFSVGNLGVKHDSVLCNEFCRAEGYAASAMPPRDWNVRTCICLDGNGREAVNTSMESIISGSQE